jgi:hypothetical protein
MGEPLTADEARRQRLVFEERLAAAPVVDVRGVVDASGSGGGSAGGAVWDLIFHFAAWRLAAEPMRTTPRMRLYYGVAKPELSRWMGTIKPYAIWRLRASVLNELVNGQIHARITEFAGEDPTDVELGAEASRLQLPVTVDDAQLGRLKLDRRYDYFEGKIDWCGQPIRLTLKAERGDAAPSGAAVATARALLADADGWRSRVNEFAVARLLALRNDNWRDTGEPALDEPGFIARMRLESIAVDGDGGFDFWHDDGDLFWGHSIQISGTLADGPIHADTPG